MAAAARWVRVRARARTQSNELLAPEKPRPSVHPRAGPPVRLQLTHPSLPRPPSICASPSRVPARARARRRPSRRPSGWALSSSIHQGRCHCRRRRRRRRAAGLLGPRSSTHSFNRLPVVKGDTHSQRRREGEGEGESSSRWTTRRLRELNKQKTVSRGAAGRDMSSV